MATIQDVTDALDRMDSLADALQSHREPISQLVPFDQLVLVLFDPDGEHMAIRWQTGPDGTEAVPRESRRITSIAGTPAEWVRREQRTLFESDTNGSAFSHHPVRAAGRRSFILVPITTDPVIGVLGFSTFAPNTYNPMHVQAAEAIASAAGRRVVAEGW